MRRNIFILLVLSLLPCICFAFTGKVKIKGIYYQISTTRQEATVEKWVGDEYEGQITIPSNVGYDGVNCRVTEIGYMAFYECKDLKSITIPSSVNKIGSLAFYNCKNLTSVSGINNVWEIGERAFFGCEKLSSDIYLYGVSKIESAVFCDCSSIKRLTIGKNTKIIDRSAFLRCYSLESIVVDNSNTFYDSRENCNAIVETESNTLISACNKSFIPNNIESIGNSAYSSCNTMDFIIIPNSVKNIKESAFYNCTKLKKVICMSEDIPNTEDVIFDSSVIGNAILYVPAKSINKYKEVSPWNQFKNIIAVDNDFIKCATPTIVYQNGTLSFGCETEGATCKYTITNEDIKSGSGNEVQLDVTYHISVYATKDGYEDSDVVTKDIILSNNTGDMNGDKKVDAADVVKLVNIIMTQQDN